MAARGRLEAARAQLAAGRAQRELGREVARVERLRLDQGTGKVEDYLSARSQELQGETAYWRALYALQGAEDYMEFVTAKRGETAMKRILGLALVLVIVLAGALAIRHKKQSLARLSPPEVPAVRGGRRPREDRDGGGLGEDGRADPVQHGGDGLGPGRRSAPRGPLPRRGHRPERAR